MENIITVFNELNKAFNDNKFDKVLENKLGKYFFKLRSLSRKKNLEELAKSQNIDIKNIQNKDLFKTLFCNNIPDEAINTYIKSVYQIERKVRLDREDDLYIQLYKLQVFNWGGFYQNAVEKTIVSNYIKKIENYDTLLKKIENDLSIQIKKYVLCSWYNHWTSIIIEDIFKDHKDVLPALGLVKKIDFFWHDFPFDLKVTYFPEGFMKIKRKEKKISSEIQVLKKFAKDNNINYDKESSDKDIHNELLLRIMESPKEEAKTFIEQFNKVRKEIIDETINNPKELITWFYENQGDTRFDASNRFFLVLIDKNNLEESWKLKRNKEVLSEQINVFLNKNIDIDFNQFKLNFNWKGNEYTTFATCLFIIK